MHALKYQLASGVIHFILFASARNGFTVKQILFFIQCFFYDNRFSVPEILFPFRDRHGCHATKAIPSSRAVILLIALRARLSFNIKLSLSLSIFLCVRCHLGPREIKMRWQLQES